MSGEETTISNELEKSFGNGASAIIRFVLQCLGGIPGAGGLFGASAGSWSEYEQSKFNKMFNAWLKLQQDEIKEIGKTLMEVMARLDAQNEEIQKRLESPEYLTIIKKCFRDWSAAESEEKRILIRNLLVTAASTRICSDDVVKLFVQWIATYSEAHFKIIRISYKNPGYTRADIWTEFDGREVREDSAEADLFKLLVHDLSLGRIIRQHREKDYQGRYLKVKRQGSRNRISSDTMVSAFDDGKDYELTELGKQFVRYTMEDVMPRITSAAAASSPETNSEDVVQNQS